MRVFAGTDDDLAAAVARFRSRGWVAVDALDAATVAQLPCWVDEIAALANGAGCVLQHYEGTDDGPLLCRSENFVPVHGGLRRLLCSGALVEVASALLDEPVVLYKEKVNYKLAGGAGYSPHQDAPAYPLIDQHVSALVAIDDADASNGALEVVSGCFDTILPLDERGCIVEDVASTLDWQVVPLRAGQTLWFHSRTPHRSAANRSTVPRRALYPTYNAAREGDLRATYYAKKQEVFATEAAGDRARVSLIGDFEGHPV